MRLLTGDFLFVRSRQEKVQRKDRTQDGVLALAYNLSNYLQKHVPVLVPAEALRLACVHVVFDSDGKITARGVIRLTKCRPEITIMTMDETLGARNRTVDAPSFLSYLLLLETPEETLLK